MIEAAAGDDGRHILSAVRDAVRHQSVSSYLVGGCVRDAILGVSSPDLDISVEGDARHLARAVAGMIGGARLTIHDAFRTATVSLGATQVDLITARREDYPSPGALPLVTPASIHDDLARRDFTVNAIAAGLTGGRRGELLDPFGGVADLDAGLIRVLHDASFRDDATRLLRAARYAARFQFVLEPGTWALAARDRGFLSTISPARVRHEYLRGFAERAPDRMLTLAGTMGLAEALVAGLRYTRAIVASWRRLTRSEWDDGVLPWLVPVLHWSAGPLAHYIDRFALTAAEGRAVRALPSTRAALSALARREHRRSEIVAQLDPLPEPALLAWVRYTPRTHRGEIAAQYLHELRHVRPHLTSATLKELGVREGPDFGRVIRALRAARLDNPDLTPDDERRLVLALSR
ncbi:MAG: CCA tRNA nucleotidyltransferase [Dehalococcoidia bacterium]